MTRMTGPDCVVMCNLINTHKTHIIGVSGSIQRTLQHNRIYFESVYVIIYLEPIMVG